MRFNQCKMANTQNNELYSKAMRKMRYIAVLLPVCRMLRVVKMYCTFQNIQEWMTAKKGSQEKQCVRGKSLYKPKFQNSYSAPLLMRIQLTIFH